MSPKKVKHCFPASRPTTWDKLEAFDRLLEHLEYLDLLPRNATYEEFEVVMKSLLKEYEDKKNYAESEDTGDILMW